MLVGYRRDELILEVTDHGAGLPAMAGAGVSHHGSTTPLGEGFAGDADPAGGGPALLAMPGWNAPGDLSGNGGPGSGPGGGVIGGSGHGIIGMRERVTLLGGEFSAGPLPGYGFQVSAHIPLPSASEQ